MCGVRNEDDAVYCQSCGAVLGSETASAEDMEETGASAAEEAAGKTSEPLLPPASPDSDVEPDTPVTREVVLAEDRIGERAEPAEEARPVRVYSEPSGTQAVPTSGLAVASFVLGIGGLTVLPLLGSIAAVLLGYLARSDIRQRPGEVTGDGLAVAGLVMGWVAIGVSILISVLAFLGILGGLCCLGPCGALSLAGG
jgi:hypothetical protein